MEGSVYNIIELVGTSSTSWEDAAKNAVGRRSGQARCDRRERQSDGLSGET